MQINNLDAAEVLIKVSKSFKEKEKDGKLIGHDYVKMDSKNNLRAEDSKKGALSFSRIGDIVNIILNDHNIRKEKKAEVLEAYREITKQFKNKKINLFVKIFCRSLVAGRINEIKKANKIIKQLESKTAALNFDTESKRNMLKSKQRSLPLIYSKYLMTQQLLNNDQIAFIEVNKRTGDQSTDIVIPIGKCDHLNLTEENLPEIVKIINNSTLNIQYAIEDNFVFCNNGIVISRPNHNGTHGARQAFGLLEALKNLIDNKGKEKYKGYLKEFIDNPDQNLNLTLAAYFLRAGRVDESSEEGSNLPPDELHERSALIYEAYAEQLNIKPDLIEWTKKLIKNATKPSDKWEQDVKIDEKLSFACRLLTTVHELDLVRCDSQKQIESKKKSTEECLNNFLKNESQADTTKLYEFAKLLCDATGCPRLNEKGDRRTERNLELFADCSTKGDVCMQKVKEVAIPKWEGGRGSPNLI